VAGREGRRQDVVVDVINGLPFGARLVRHRGLLALVHHVHRAQWEIIYPGWRGRLGWFVESRLTPALYRSTTHVTVSDATRRDLEGLGIPPARVTVVRNGLDQAPHLEMFAHSPEPRLCVLSRLVPHKQIEHALEVTARLAPAFPGLHLDVVGDGWWARQLIGAATGLGDIVTFHGHVDPRTRDRLLAEAWVLLLPSVKEGWGLAVMEGAAQGTPAVCYRYAGGVNESVVSGVTGLLVDDLDAMVDATARLLGDDALRARMSAAAALRARDFSWDETARAFEEVLVAQLPVSADRR
jgi:glycosyltransferase involved in cell wall biosynthesis